MTTLRRYRVQWSFALLTTITILALTLLAAAVVREAGASGTTATVSSTKTVKIVGLVYRPGTLSIKRGTSVAFTNSDSSPHTATRAGSFDTGTIKAGKTVMVTFKKKGTFAYHCTIHPSMKGKIVVG